MGNYTNNKIKLVCNLSRASGLASGIQMGVELIEDLNRKGVIEGLKEIQELIKKSIEEISNDK